MKVVRIRERIWQEKHGDLDKNRVYEKIGGGGRGARQITQERAGNSKDN